MKKVIALLLMAAMALTLVACSKSNSDSTSGASTEDTTAKSEGVMTYAEYDAAAVDDQVVIEAYVQGKQDWWEDKATLYLQDGDGGYFVYEAACSEEDYAKLVDGQKIKVTGYKAEWSGEIEITDATIEIEDGNWVAEPVDVTDKLGDEEALKKYQNQKVTVKGLTVASEALYKWDGSGSQGDDLYFNVSNGSAEFTFTVESYLTGADTDVYKAVEALAVDQNIDIEGFLYWYEGAQPHVTKVTVNG